MMFSCFSAFTLIFMLFYSDSSRILSEVVFEDFGSAPCSLVLVLLIFFFLNVNLMLMCVSVQLNMSMCLCVCLCSCVCVESSGWCLQINPEAA